MKSISTREYLTKKMNAYSKNLQSQSNSFSQMLGETLSTPILSETENGIKPMDDTNTYDGTEDLYNKMRTLIPDETALNQILSKLSQDIINVLATNYDSAVVPKFTEYKNKSLSMTIIVNMLNGIGKELISKQLPYDYKQEELQEKFYEEQGTNNLDIIRKLLLDNLFDGNKISVYVYRNSSKLLKELVQKLSIILSCSADHYAIKLAIEDENSDKILERVYLTIVEVLLNPISEPASALSIGKDMIKIILSVFQKGYFSSENFYTESVKAVEQDANYQIENKVSDKNDIVKKIDHKNDYSKLCKLYENFQITPKQFLETCFTVELLDSLFNAIMGYIGFDSQVIYEEIIHGNEDPIPENSNFYKPPTPPPPPSPPLSPRPTAPQPNYENKFFIDELQNSKKLNYLTIIDKINAFIDTNSKNPIYGDVVETTFKEWIDNKLQNSNANETNTLKLCKLDNIQDFMESLKKIKKSKYTGNKKPFLLSLYYALKTNVEHRQQKLGRGLNNKIKPHFGSGSKYYIDRKKLSNNILEIRYSKNNHLNGMKSHFVGSGFKTVLENALDKKQIDGSQYKKLNGQEKHLMYNTLKHFDLEHLVDDNSDDFNKEFEIIRGEILAGNDSHILKKKARHYLLYAVKMGKISRDNYNNLLDELDL